MQESLPTLKGCLAGCALLALASCGGGGTAPSLALGSGTAPTSSEQALHSGGKRPKVTPQTSGTPNSLIAVSAVNGRVVWVSGRFGTFGVTTDGGATWRTGVVPGAETHQFRDVQGVSERVAYLLAIPSDDGTEPSAIYKTVDGGNTWTLQTQGRDVNEFFDCFAFWDARSAIAMVDSVGDQLPIRRTLDGHTWVNIGHRLAPALPGESGFAASGTCAATQGHRRGWLTTGTPPADPTGLWTTRVHFTTDRGQTWGVTTAPITAPGDSFGGGSSIAFRDARHGILGGGDFLAAGVVPNFARSNDGGRTWVLGTSAPIPGAIYGLAYAGHGKGGDDDDEGEHQHADDRRGSIRVVATAPTGSAWSGDEGRTWTSLAGLSGLWAVDFGSEKTGWLVGTQGQIVRIDF
ncbi:MAG TPA: hypothetical protein VLT82_21625 [Myxococcaceae bacterium]|nr:hypothetical protein [Myxococcaceae bacterium]